MNEYSPFNPIMLTFFDVSNTSYISIGVFNTVWHIIDSISTEKYVRHFKKIYCNWVKRIMFIHF